MPFIVRKHFQIVIPHRTFLSARWEEYGKFSSQRDFDNVVQYRETNASL